MPMHQDPLLVELLIIPGTELLSVLDMFLRNSCKIFLNNIFRVCFTILMKNTHRLHNTINGHPRRNITITHKVLTCGLLTITSHPSENIHCGFLYDDSFLAFLWKWNGHKHEMRTLSAFLVVREIRRSNFWRFVTRSPVNSPHKGHWLWCFLWSASE